MDLVRAKESLDKIIKKARVHLYKPIQIAEILYRDRVEGDIDLSKCEFLSSDDCDFNNFLAKRMYDNKQDSFWE